MIKRNTLEYFIENLNEEKKHIKRKSKKKYAFYSFSYYSNTNENIKIKKSNRYDS